VSVKRPGLLLLLVVFLFTVVPSAVDFYTDWLWFGETGYQGVFLTRLRAQAQLALGALLVTALLVYLNLRPALGRARPREFVIMTPEGPRPIRFEPQRFRPLLTVAALGAGVLAGLVAASQWETWLFYRHATPFGQVDPVLGYDVGFYVFSLPFFEFVHRFALALLVLVLVVTAAAYFLSGSVTLDPVRGVGLAGPARRHLALLGAGVFVLLAIGAWLAQPALLSSSSEILHGASFVDVSTRLPVLRVQVVVALLAATLAFYQVFAGRAWPLVAAIGVYVLVALGGAGVAGAVQRLVVAPNEQTKETPYIVHNIDATRRAYGLDTVVERPLSGDALLSRADIDRNAATLENVPLWNHQPLLDTFGQIQEIRTYYEFASVFNDRYWIDGKYRQVMLSARELSSESLPNRTWINERLTFTHGYGLTLGPVNQVTPEGLPVLFVKNLPPESTVDLQVTEPSLYFGELPNDHVFVRTRTREFHYPKGDDNVYTTYEGTGGVPVGTFWRKLVFAVKFRSMKTLLSNDLTAESRVIFHRRIADRVRRIAPFLTYEEDRYLSIADGRLYWIQDAYTTTDRYPYSRPAVRGINYIRNAVKVTVDAYHGTTGFYLVDPTDPIAATIAKAFPGLLRPLEQMPEGLRSRLRYPQGIFQLQVGMFSTYHMTNPAVFYNKEDQWEVPTIEGAGRDATRMLPYYTIMRLPGEREPEFIQMLPLTPRQKDNLAAWMVARSDHPNYGKLMVFQFPKQKVVFGPRQVVARINQDQVISPQITLWNQQGSEVIQGTLLVIPIEESLIYIRPLYLRSQGGRIPELKRVIVAYQNQIVMEETLEEALARIFPPGSGSQPIEGLVAMAPTAVPAPGPTAESGGAVPPPPPAATRPAPDAGASRDALIAEAQATYERALAAQRAGNWAQYGEEIQRLGRLLDRLGAGPQEQP
jgi:hypothetical protein